MLIDLSVALDTPREDAWSLVFYVFGGAGMAWYPLWLWLSHALPSDHLRLMYPYEPLDSF